MIPGALAATRAVVVLCVLVVGVAAAQGVPLDPPGDGECPVPSGMVVTLEEEAVYQSCVLRHIAARLDEVTPGAEFVEALPVLALLVVAGIGWRVGTGF